MDGSNAAHIRAVLRFWGLPPHEAWYTPDGLVVAALLCNAAAKLAVWYGEDQDYYYAIKPRLVETAAAIHADVWRGFDGFGDLVVYFETAVGQISFHVFCGEGDWDALPTHPGRRWARGRMQDYALDVAWAFLAVATNGDDAGTQMLVARLERRVLNRQYTNGCGTPS